MSPPPPTDTPPEPFPAKARAPAATAGSALPNHPPLLLGAAVRHEWALHPGFLTVNHGSFGATPRVVQAVQAEWRARLEAQPTRFMAIELPAALRTVADRLGAFLGARGEDIALLDNATTGCNAVLRSLRLQPGDEVLVLSHGYNAVRQTVRFVTERAGARMTEAALPFPCPDAAGLAEAVTKALGPRTRLAVIDHVTSGSALVMPLAAIVAACHDAGVPVLVDGAHAPGQLDLDLEAIRADWYAGNCHKWLCAPKGSAFLWARPDRQADLHPTVISHGYRQGFGAEFGWTGTRDPTPFLAIPAALDFHARLGGAALRARNAALAAAVGADLAARWGTEMGNAGCSAAMAVVRLPDPPGADDVAALSLRSRLLALDCDAPLHAIDGALWLRLSVFAYNEPVDYDRLFEVVNAARSD